jgi:HPt (histidine-containing phosphotransfer) domain-containing protein
MENIRAKENIEVPLARRILFLHTFYRSAKGSTMRHEEKKITVKADPEFAPLIPGYLKNRLADADKISVAVTAGDFEKARRLGHCMKGSGAGYGFDAITEIGRAIETAAKAKNAADIAAQAELLRDYLNRVEVVYD